MTVVKTKIPWLAAWQVPPHTLRSCTVSTPHAQTDI